LVAVVALAGTPAGPAEGPLTEIREAHARVRDLVVQVERREVREGELQRMKRNATTALEFSKVKVYFMAPDRLRLEGKYGLVPVTMIENGNIKLYRFGLGMKRRRDFTGQPGKKQGGLEFGLLAGEVWRDYLVTVVGQEELEQRPALVLSLKARADRSGSYYKVWLDAESFRVLRRDRLTGEGALKHRYLFRQPFQAAAGTWLSRRIEIFNQDGKFVGALALTGFQINQGLAESLFGT
jgi:outer membrane lipoprotein-sorting protein